LIEINSPIFIYEPSEWEPRRIEWGETSSNLVFVLDVLSNQEFLNKPFRADFASSRAAVYEPNGIDFNDDIRFIFDETAWDAIVKIFFKNYFGWIILYDDEYKFIKCT